MIKVVYDYQVFYWSKYGGIARYIYEVATRIAQINGFEAKILAGFHINQYLGASTSAHLVAGWQVPPLPKTQKFLRAVDRWLSYQYLAAQVPDIVHETYYSVHRLAPTCSKIVLTVHDMIHERFSESMDQSIPLVKAAAVRRADRIICVSESTKRDLVEMLEVDPEKITTIHLGCSLTPLSAIESGAAYPGDRPYILYVGDRESPYKNFNRLVQAYASAPEIRNQFSLVCFGGQPFSQAELALFQSHQLTDDQVIYRVGSDRTLTQLYTHAAALIYPSLYEGFGLPPLEAMTLKCPVVCSQTSSIPEVVCRAGQYFDPYDVDSMVEALEKVLFSSYRSEELRQLGLERAKEFSWEICAQKTQQVYASLMTGNGYFAG